MRLTPDQIINTAVAAGERTMGEAVREACARIAEASTLSHLLDNTKDWDKGWNDACAFIAAKIREQT